MLEIGRSTTITLAKKAPLEINGTSAMALEATVEPLDLVRVEPQDVQTVFTNKEHLDPILAKLAAEVRSIISDVTTAKGRDEIKSRAFRVSKAKTYLDGLGMDLVSKMKELPKKIDANRKAMRDFLDSLRDEVRKPLDDYEAEQDRLEAERKAQEEAAALVLEIENAHEFGLLLDRQRDHDLAEEARAEEARQKAEAERRREEARLEAEEEAREELAAAARREQEALAAAARAEQLREETLARAARERELADQRVAKAAQEATEREHARQQAAIKAEEEATAARTRD